MVPPSYVKHPSPASCLHTAKPSDGRARTTARVALSSRPTQPSRVAAVAALLVVVRCQATWPQRGVDAQHHSFTTNFGPATAPHVVWSLVLDTTQKFDCSPSIGPDGTAYVQSGLWPTVPGSASQRHSPVSARGGADDQRAVFAFGPGGAQLWNFTTTTSISTPAVANGFVIFGSEVRAPQSVPGGQFLPTPADALATSGAAPTNARTAPRRCAGQPRVRAARRQRHRRVPRRFGIRGRLRADARAVVRPAIVP